MYTSTYLLYWYNIPMSIIAPLKFPSIFPLILYCLFIYIYIYIHIHIFSWIFPCIPIILDNYMGLFKNSVSLRPVVNHHCPYQITIIGAIPPFSDTSTSFPIDIPMCMYVYILVCPFINSHLFGPLIHTHVFPHSYSFYAW